MFFWWPIRVRECSHYWDGDNDVSRFEYFPSEDSDTFDKIEVLQRIDRCRLCNKAAIKIVDRKCVGKVSSKEGKMWSILNDM